MAWHALRWSRGTRAKKTRASTCSFPLPRAYASCVRACRARIARRRWDGGMHSSLGAKEEDGTRDDARQGPSKEPASLSRRVLSESLWRPRRPGLCPQGFGCRDRSRFDPIRLKTAQGANSGPKIHTKASRGESQRHHVSPRVRPDSLAVEGLREACDLFADIRSCVCAPSINVVWRSDCRFSSLRAVRSVTRCVRR